MTAADDRQARIARAIGIRRVLLAERHAELREEIELLEQRMHDAMQELLYVTATHRRFWDHEMRLRHAGRGIEEAA